MADHATGGYWDQGGCCENDVHEHFKCLEEVALTSAYILECEDGSLACWNCRAAWDNRLLTIRPTENCVCAVHFNLRQPIYGNVRFSDQEVGFVHQEPWMFWVKRRIDRNHFATE